MSLTRVAEPAPAVTAIAFLTRLPVSRAPRDATAVGAAAPFFPVVGALLLLATGAIALAADAFAPALLAAALALAFLALATGALHLDALADTADALGGQTREDRLRIMRDHAVGAFGAVAVSLTLLVEATAVAALIEQDAGVAAFAAVGAASRSIAPALAAAIPSARPGDPTTATAAFRPARSLVALTVAAAINALAGLSGIAIFGSALIVGAAAGVLCRRWIGGVTGDTVGAAIQVAETAGLVVAVALA